MNILSTIICVYSEDIVTKTWLQNTSLIFCCILKLLHVGLTKQILQDNKVSSDMAEIQHGLNRNFKTNIVGRSVSK